MHLQDSFVVAEEPFRRRPADVARFVLGLVLFALLVWRVDVVTSLDKGIVELVQSLPSGLAGIFDFSYNTGAFWFVLGLVGLALLARRFRLARDLFVAGTLAWVAARFLAFFISDADVAGAFDKVAETGVTPSFPLARVAVAAAVLTTGWPYVTRPVRRTGVAVIVIVATAALYRGSGIPRDVTGGLVLGFLVGALVHLVWGSPAGRPTTAQVGDALGELGLRCSALRLGAGAERIGTVMEARSASGDELVVKVFGRDEADAQLFAKVWRFLAYKDSGPTLPLTRLQQVEHEAYVTLLAARAGVRVPDVILAGQAGPDAAVLVVRSVPGVALADVEPGGLTDGQLDGLWSAAARLWDARIAHGALNPEHIVVDGDDVTIVDFSRSSSSAPAERLAGDLAELLTVSALWAGIDRTIAAARRVVDAERIEAALAVLQPRALTRPTLAARRGNKKILDELRGATAAAIGSEPPRLEQLYRIKPVNVLIFVGTIFGVSMLLSQIGNPADLWNELENAEWEWVAVVVVFWIGTKLSDAVCMLGAVQRRIPYGPTAILQFALSFIGFAVPKVGSISLATRYLQRQGVESATAVSSGALPSVVSGIVQGVVLVICLFTAGSEFDVSDSAKGTAADALKLVFVLGIVAGVLLSIGPLRRRLMPLARTMLANVLALAKSPRKTALMFTGKTFTMLFFAMCLGASLRAFGVETSLSTLIIVNALSSLVSSAVPVPGGLGVTEAALVALLTATGIPSTEAVAGVLLYRAVVSWLPPLWGSFAFRYLQNREYV